MKFRSSIQVANYLLKKAENDNQTLTPMQIIKLVYLCHGWMFGLYGRQFLADDIEAWQYGPVIRNLYNAVKEFRSQAVPYPIKDDCGGFEKLDGENNFVGEKVYDDSGFNDTEKNIMDQVYEHYGNYSGVVLSRLTHKEGSPWDRTWTPTKQNSIISNDIIQDYYQELYRELTEEEQP